MLVDFWAEWCAPCQMLTPVLEKLATEFEGRILLAKVDCDQHQELAIQYGIRSLPTIKVFKNAKIVDEFMGVIPETEIKHIIERHVDKEIHSLREEALSAAQLGDVNSAISLLTQAMHEDPQDNDIKLDLAGLLITLRKTAVAKELLTSLPEEIKNSTQAKALSAHLEFAEVSADAPNARDLEQRVAIDPDDLEVRYQLSACYAVSGKHEAALQQFFEIMQRDRQFKNDAGRKGMLGMFDMLTTSGELVSRYRNKMFALLH